MSAADAKAALGGAYSGHVSAADVQMPGIHQQSRQKSRTPPEMMSSGMCDFPAQSVYPLPTFLSASFEQAASSSPPAWAARPSADSASNVSSEPDTSSPPSPGSSKSSSGQSSVELGSFADVVPFPYPPRRNVFIEPGSGMRDVPMWLKTLRLHKYTSLFQQISYDDMLGLNEAQLEHQGVTKGARHKIVVCVTKLKERGAHLRALEKELGGSTASLRGILHELRGLVCTPIRPFPPPGRPEPYQSRIDGIDVPAEELDDENLPAHFTRVLGKLATAIFAAMGAGGIPDGPDDLFPTLLHVLDRCLNHEAFTQAQKRRVVNWKQIVKRVWHPQRRPPPPSPMHGYGGFGPQQQRGPPPFRRFSPPHPGAFAPPAHRQTPTQPPRPDIYAQQTSQKQAVMANWQLQAMLGYFQAFPPAMQGAPPTFRSIQEIAGAMAAYGGLVQPTSSGCRGGCGQAPLVEREWSRESGVDAWRPAPAAVPSPKAADASDAWAMGDLSSRLETLCRSVAEVALVEAESRRAL